MRNLVIALLYFCCVFVNAQQVSIAVTGIPAAPATLYINGYYGDEKYPVDTLELQDNIPQAITVSPLKPGLYSFYIAGGDTGIFVIGTDKVLQATGTYGEVLKGISVQFNICTFSDSHILF